MRKYFDAAMLTLVSDQETGARIPFCSKMTVPSAFLITASWLRHWTVSNAVLPRGTRRETGIGSLPIRADGRATGSSEAGVGRFRATAIEAHSFLEDSTREVRAETRSPGGPIPSPASSRNAPEVGPFPAGRRCNGTQPVPLGTPVENLRLALSAMWYKCTRSEPRSGAVERRRSKRQSRSSGRTLPSFRVSRRI